MKAITQKIGALFAGLLLASAAMAADAFPSRPVTMMVPYPAGGLSDTIGRLISSHLSKQLGQPVQVENLGGMSGAIAAQKVLDAPGDGYYLFQASPNEVILSPLANSAVRFKSENFRMVQLIGLSPMVLIARKDLPASSADEVVTLARKVSRERPLTYGSVGTGSFYHLMGAFLGETIHANLVHTPYKGIAPLLQDMGDGKVDIAMLPYSKQYQALVEKGRMKIIGTLSGIRPEPLKNLPTVNEGKLLKNFGFSIWTGYMVRKDTPDSVVERLNKAISAALAEPAVRAQLEAQSMMVAAPMTLAEGNKQYVMETSIFRAIAQFVNMQPQ